MRTAALGTGTGLVVVVATLAASAATTGSTTARRGTVRTALPVSSACTRHVGESYVAMTGDGVAGPVTLALGSSLRLRFPGSSGFRWSRPTSTRPAVVTVDSLVRCPHHVVVAVAHALHPGTATLNAYDRPIYPDPPTFGWQLPVTVPAHPRPPAPAPALAKMVRGGGVLAFPPRLLLGGAGDEFTVPHVSCLAGRAARVTIGMAGVKRTTTPAGRKSLGTWTAGVTISCTGTTHPTYTVGFTSPGEKPEHYRLPAGDDVSVDTSGANCPSPGVNWSAPDSTSGRGIGDGCVSGPNMRNHVQTLPVLLFGAHLRGQLAQPVRVALRTVSENGTPMRLLPHLLRTQSTSTGPVVVAHRVATNWYRFTLTIG